MRFRMLGLSTLGSLGLVLVAGLPLPETAVALEDIRGNLRRAPGLVGLRLPPQYRQAVDELVREAARAVPVPATSAAFTYRFDSTSGTYERTSETLGPMLFMERPQTIGRFAWHVGVTGQYVELDEYDGHGVGRDPNPVVVGGQAVRFSATPKFLYHMAHVLLTYGVLDDLDVNLTIPLAAVDGDMNAQRQRPSGGPLGITTLHGSVPLGVGDVHVRFKYHLLDWEGISTAVGLDTRIPSGDEKKALGTGEAELTPYLAASTLLWDRLEPHANVGMNFNATSSDRSSVSYSVGLGVVAHERVTVAGAFLGRSELQTAYTLSSIGGPHVTASGPGVAPYAGLSTDRKDYLDATLGVHIRLYRTLVLTLGAMYALNDDGIRMSDLSPLGALQASF